MDEFVLQIYRETEPVLNDNGIWEQLLHQSQHDTIFMTPGWLKAAWISCDPGCELWIVVIYQNQLAIAAGAFLNQFGRVEFLGTGSADYLDILLHQSLTQQQKECCLEQILQALSQAIQPFKYFYLKNIITGFQTPKLLQALTPRFYIDILAENVAPFMTMDKAPEALKKKSLRRYENKLQKSGKLSFETVTTEREILDRLNTLFEQHVQRWEGTDSPSLFNLVQNRRLYRELTLQLATRGWLRYTEIRFNDLVIACHFGSFYNSIFTWYKPSFNPQMAAYSPGEVLIKTLINQAQLENASVFDFTVGKEAFKFRFANSSFNLVSIYITNSWLRYHWLKGKDLMKCAIRQILSTLGLLPWAKRIRKAHMTRQQSRDRSDAVNNSKHAQPSHPKLLSRE